MQKNYAMQGVLRSAPMPVGLKFGENDPFPANWIAFLVRNGFR